MVPRLRVVLLLLLARAARRAGAYPAYPPGGSCNVNGPQTLCIGAPFSSNAVLQRAPAAAAITGSVPLGYGVPPMRVTVALRQEDGSGFSHNVSAEIRADRTWKVLLPPRPTFGNYSLSASCTAGCSGANATATAELVNLTFGDVYVCSGQSNMQARPQPVSRLEDSRHPPVLTTYSHRVSLTLTESQVCRAPC